MSVTMDQVRASLIPIEPDYAAASKLGPEALPHLEQLATGADVALAARAVYLASLIPGERSAQVLLDAARSPVAEVRVQAAGGARNLAKDKAQQVLVRLLGDADAGVRNFALKSSRVFFPKGNMPEAIQEKIAALSDSDPEAFIREFAAGLMK